MQWNTTHSEQLFLFTTSENIYNFLCFRENQIIFKGFAKSHVYTLRNAFISILLKKSNLCAKRKVSRKFGCKAVKFGVLLCTQHAFSIKSMWFQSIQCEFSNFIERYVSQFRKFLLEASLTQNVLMGYIYFGLGLTLTRATHAQRRCQCQIQSHCTILFGTWSWKVLNVFECDKSWFCLLLEVRDRYLCAMQRKYSILGGGSHAKRAAPKSSAPKKNKIRKTEMCRFYTRENGGKGKKIKCIKIHPVLYSP